MSPILAALYGIVEGVTEFLPISSTGHLILLDRLLGVASSEFQKSFEIAIQLGAISAVVWLYRQKLSTSLLVWKKVLAAFVPTAVIGLALHGVVKEYLLGNEMVVLAALAIGGAAIIVFEKFAPLANEAIAAPEGVSYRDAFAIGSAQALALIPGVSRSAATIIAGRMRRIPRTVIVEFSFLLAIPTMLAATALDLLKSYDSFTRDDLPALAVGFVVSSLVAMLAVRYLVRYVAHHDFTAFGIYRIVLAVVFWLFVV